MDSLTQIVLGSSVAALAAPAKHRRPALVAGGILATLPDLDVLWFSLAGSDAVTEVTWHRGPSHSLFVLTVCGWLLWWLLKQRSQLVREAPRRWLLAIWLALLTHPLLDAFTVYGTQLLWPLQMPPVMWASIFVIDPLYTLPLLVGVVAAWRFAPREANRRPAAARQRSVARQWLAAGLLVSSAYLAWGVAAKLWVDRVASQSLAVMGLQDAPRFSTPLPFNTLLWRVIVMAPDGYWIGDRSMIADRGEMPFAFHASDNRALAQVAATPQVQRLLWFTHGFTRAQPQRRDDGELRLVLSDLRMGFEPDYFFRYDIAGMDAHGQWVAAPEIVRMPASGDRVAALNWVWRRLYDSDAQP
ncbi:metal-dependent hydrolase [Brenneria goodwinii]|uniref:Membrane-bound metal-dependent hydrolase n=1 Tax=Brenneria goodwinii TaxID=1109412 RepID=A0A0G4JX15_9GAMM|nr:metal-dependent hydrolase [Brenneria goodwinii]CPR17968.1 Membrane-bound metal-dependent hydrolase [Brenneria goodwinii]